MFFSHVQLVKQLGLYLPIIIVIEKQNIEFNVKKGEEIIFV